MFCLHRTFFSYRFNTSGLGHIICVAEEHSVLLLQYAQHSTKLNVLSSTISQHSNSNQFNLKEVTNSRNKRQATIHSQYWEPSSCVTSPVVSPTCALSMVTAGWGGAKRRSINNCKQVTIGGPPHTHALWIAWPLTLQETSESVQESTNETHFKFFLFYLILFKHMSCILTSADILNRLHSGSPEQQVKYNCHALSLYLRHEVGGIPGLSVSWQD